MKIRKCAVCGSDKMIPNVAIRDSQSLSIKAQVISKPEAILFKDPVYSQLRAWICGECGYVMLFVRRPKKLYQAYLASRARTKQQKS